VERPRKWERSGRKIKAQQSARDAVLFETKSRKKLKVCSRSRGRGLQVKRKDAISEGKPGSTKKQIAIMGEPSMLSERKYSLEADLLRRAKRKGGI